MITLEKVWWIQMIFSTQVHKIETKTKFKSVTLNQMLSELLHFVIFLFYSTECRKLHWIIKKIHYAQCCWTIQWAKSKWLIKSTSIFLPKWVFVGLAILIISVLLCFGYFWHSGGIRVCDTFLVTSKIETFICVPTKCKISLKI